MANIFFIFFSGICACCAMDLWQQFLERMFKAPATNWGIVGRWFLILIKEKKIFIPSVANEPSLKYEVFSGWIVHYCVAILYSLVFWILAYFLLLLPIGFFGGLIFGVLSVIVPWFFFMPCLGNGILARNTDNPFRACLLALASHSVFGMSLGTVCSIFFTNL